MGRGRGVKIQWVWGPTCHGYGVKNTQYTMSRGAKILFGGRFNIPWIGVLYTMVRGSKYHGSVV